MESWKAGLTRRKFLLGTAATVSSTLLAEPLFAPARDGIGASDLFHGMANAQAFVVRGNVRFTILTSQLVRMEWSEDGVFEDRPSLVFIQRDLPVPKFTVGETSEWLTIKTEKLTLKYNLGSGRFTAENLSIMLPLNGQTVTWVPGTEDPLNLRGTTRTLDKTDGAKDVHLEQGIVSRSGWALVDDSKSLLFDSSDWPWAMERPVGERQDLYFFGHGHNYKQALYDFTFTAGKIPIPPKFVFGYWWSRWWAYSDTELRELVSGFKVNGLPIDVLIIDMDWHYTSWPNAKPGQFHHANGWTGYTWNRNLFPDPTKFLAWTATQNLKVAMNLHPASGISPMEEKYEAFAKVYGFDTSTKAYIPFAMENKKWARTYFDVVLHPLQEQGVRFWWLDWQQWLDSRVLNGLSVTWWLNYTFFTDMQGQGKQRPIIYSRWGGLGNHRYPLGFSGDAWGTWESLDFQPYFTTTAANVCYGYWGHDIGGFTRVNPDPEMFVRWIQFGVLSPIFKTHSAKSNEVDRRFWFHPEQLPIIRQAVELRYALAPYIYSAARQAYDTGISPCRPLYYDFPESVEAYDCRGQYMFGDDILAAPVTQKSSTETDLSAKKIWLPEGNWYAWSSGTLVEGGKTIDGEFSLNEIPMYVKAGAILPMYPKIANLEEPIDTLILTAIPGGNGHTRLYEDDGTTSAYERNQFAFTSLKKEILMDGDVRVTILPREGSYHGMTHMRSYELVFRSSFPPARVTVNGVNYSYSPDAKQGFWTYTGADLAVRVVTPYMPMDRKTEVVLSVNPSTKGKDALLQGKIGLFVRAQAMNGLIRGFHRITPPASLLRMEETPIAIQYSPQRAVDYLEAIDRNFGTALQEVEKLRLDKTAMVKIMAQLFPGEILPQPEHGKS